MKQQSPLKSEIVDQLKRAKAHLEYSFNKVQKIPLDHPLSEEAMEVFESFTTRFGRYSDLLVAKYLRILALETDPGFRGTVIDLFNLAEKQGWIMSAQTWRRIRELRNISAHDYAADDVVPLYRELIALTPDLLSISLTL